MLLGFVGWLVLWFVVGDRLIEFWLVVCCLVEVLDVYCVVVGVVGVLVFGVVN